ncbi:T9SS type A sorting domain-containing protein [Candidatus Poribacteria bacterium]|nr:T9SS type A sorting domain-containing protein [Candidatus Poribacteria bacterium]
MVGSYVDQDGIYHPYIRTPAGRYVSIDLPRAALLDYFFVHGINDAGTMVARAKPKGEAPITFVGTFREGLKDFKVPGSLSTEGYNINQDGSIVGNYVSDDGRTHGFIARLISETDVPVPVEPLVPQTEFNYTFESINIPGVDFLELTASSDFEDYAGNTHSADGQKTVGFTLIDGVFSTYDFPGSKNTFFYALGNNGDAAGHYEDSDGLFHGVILINGELSQFDFPGAVQTFIYGYSDATGALTGNFIDESGIRRGFSGERIVEFPNAPETYADFINTEGRMVGSYVDPDGTFHPFTLTANGRFLSIDLQNASDYEYFFLHGINDVGTLVGRAQKYNDIPRTYVGSFQHGLVELNYPGSVSTEGYNINQDGSIVGNYKSDDGRTHGFIARPVTKALSDFFDNTFNMTLSKGLNMLSVPLAPPTPMTAKSLAGITGSTMVIALEAKSQSFIGWTPNAPNDGFQVEGGQGYIVNVPKPRNFAFTGSRWTTHSEDAASPAVNPLQFSQETWAFVVSGKLDGKSTYDGYKVIVRNIRTNNTISANVEGDYFAAATADLTRKSVVNVGDVIEVQVIAPDGNIESRTLRLKVSPEDLVNAMLSVNIDEIGKPINNQLLQNYPNPFNPETWIPYQLSEESSVSVKIYDTTGKLIRSLPIGIQSPGFYNSRDRAAYWDGRNVFGEQVSSGIYFYQLTTPTYQQTRRLVIVK